MHTSNFSESSQVALNRPLPLATPGSENLVNPGDLASRGSARKRQGSDAEMSISDWFGEQDLGAKYA